MRLDDTNGENTVEETTTEEVAEESTEEGCAPAGGVDEAREVAENGGQDGMSTAS